MNLKKKVVAMGMVCALALGMATSAFAAETISTRNVQQPVIIGRTYRVHNAARNQYLNVDVPNKASLASDKNVNTWPATGDSTQTWYIAPTEYGASYMGCAGTLYAINGKQTSKNCDVVHIYENNPQDYLLMYPQTTGNHLKIRFVNTDFWGGYYMNATSSMVYGKGYNVNWSKAPSNPNSDCWDFCG